CFDALAARARVDGGPAELEQWLLDWSELTAALDEESSRRYIAMTCHTDDPAAEQAYLHFIEEIEPRLKPRQFELEQAYLEHPARPQLAPARYEVLDRNTRAHVELFRQENIPLETDEAKLGQQYQKLAGALTVRFRGQERTLVQMGKYLEEPDRPLRQEAWELVAHRRLAEADNFDGCFDQLIELRERIARNAGFPNYRDYAFRALRRFDYTPEDCLGFHDAIAHEVMPLVRELQARRRHHLGLARLRPWDLAVDPRGRPPLQPFEQVDSLITSTAKIFADLDRELAVQFDQMRDLHLLDLANRKGKAPGGYQCTLAETRLPFIFMNAVGIQRDVETLLHEAGHAFHTFATRGEPLHAYRSAPIEFCEVASMSMELLGNQFLQAFYTGPDASRARHDHLENVILIFPWIATIDAFQHWLYLHPRHTRTERATAWTSLLDRFGGEVDWTGYEAVRAALWHRQLHLFLHPFYYIEYGIAQLGALQVWVNARHDPVQALRAYKRGLALGGTRPLPELFAAAGGRFDFSATTVKPLIHRVREELTRLE
ncbi:MAG: M3 family oligoendopeptidase, partial [Verrucomicrobia bacterium]|nr:M3 family oligoendopeptidase [Verrucomicrobiota bacterium]